MAKSRIFTTLISNATPKRKGRPGIDLEKIRRSGKTRQRVCKFRAGKQGESFHAKEGKLRTLLTRLAFNFISVLGGVF